MRLPLFALTLELSSGPYGPAALNDLLGACATLHRDLLSDTAIDLALPFKLSFRQPPLAARTDQELIFSVIDVSHLAPMLDDVEVSVGIRVFCNAFQAIEQVARINSNKSIDANVANVSGLACDAICYVAMFFDLLAARAVIELFRDLNTHQVPLGSGYLE